jgi:hypothetical protein
MKGIVARDFFVFKPLLVMPLDTTRARFWFVFAFTELFRFECELAESPESADTCSESAVSQISLTHKKNFLNNLGSLLQKLLKVSAFSDATDPVALIGNRRSPRR